MPTIRNAARRDSAALAAKPFNIYKRQCGVKLHLLPDFLIGAHAAAANQSVLTRNAARYRSYFPRSAFLAP